jgi:Outer membrane protein beta-barrel domain
MERQRFEDNWKDAFEGSAMTPTDSVWDNIELKLDNEKMKRRVIYYQRLAAAAVLFATLIGIGSLRFFGGEKEEILVRNERQVIEKEGKSLMDTTHLSPGNNSPGKINAHTAVLSSQGVKKENQIKVKVSREVHNVDDEGVDNNKHVENSFKSIATFSQNNDSTNGITNSSNLMDLIVSNNQSLDSSLAISKAEVTEPATPLIKKEGNDAVMPLFQLNELPVIESDKKRNIKDALWISLGASSGSYDPGSNPSATPSQGGSSLGAASYNKNMKPQSAIVSRGLAFSMGVTIGRKITDRWMVQTGINYLNQAIDYTSVYAANSSDQLKDFVSDYSRLSENTLANQSQDPSVFTITQPYTIHSNSEFVSIPVQMGYLIINRKFGIQLNAGIASDIFLRNTLKDESNSSNRFSKSSGEESPYRLVNWSGITSTEFSYKLAKQYRIALVPGFRYAFQPALKMQSGISANPLVLDIGFRVRYVFQ